MNGGQSDLLTNTSVWEVATGVALVDGFALEVAGPLNRPLRLATLEPRSGQIRGTSTCGR